MTTYTTKHGDMWDGIAYTQMGSDSYTGDLMRANRQYLSYYIFPAGITLTIPDVDEDITPSTLPPWKQVSADE